MWVVVEILLNGDERIRAFDHKADATAFFKRQGDRMYFDNTVSKHTKSGRYD